MIGDFTPPLGHRLLTPLYDPIVRWAVRGRTLKRRLLADAGLDPGDRVLDAGCGTGTLLAMLGEAGVGLELAGVDPDPAVIGRARSRLRSAGVEAALERGSAASLPHPDRSFDHVFSTLVFHHLPPEAKEEAAREARRVLRDGGALHVADFDAQPGPVGRAAYFLFVRLLDGLGRTRGHADGLLVDLLREAGFAGVRRPGRVPTVAGSVSLFRARRRSGGADQPSGGHADGGSGPASTASGTTRCPQRSGWITAPGAAPGTAGRGSPPRARSRC